MSNKKTRTHLKLEDRVRIEHGLNTGETRSQIAAFIAVNRSTITKEIQRNSNKYPSSKFDKRDICKYRLKCFRKYSCDECKYFEPKSCDYKTKHKICNGCPKFKQCRLDKEFYHADKAQQKADNSLIQSREGFDLDKEEIDKIGKILRHELKECQNSPYIILENHPEINLSVKSLYTYIDAGLFKDYGVINLSLRRKPGRKITRKYGDKLKKRTNRKYLENRTYADYLQFMENYNQYNKIAYVLEMDTVYNDVSNGPFIQTFMIRRLRLFFAILHKEKTSAAMTEGVKELVNIMGEDLFHKYVTCILTDRGSEFIQAEEIEQITGVNVFYCDPMAANQKGMLENCHIIVRYMLPKNKDLYKLGLRTQDDLNKVVSAVNSLKRKELNGVSAFALSSLLAPDLIKKIEEYGIKPQLSTVILSPKILQ